MERRAILCPSVIMKLHSGLCRPSVSPVQDKNKARAELNTSAALNVFCVKQRAETEKAEDAMMDPRPLAGSERINYFDTNEAVARETGLLFWAAQFGLRQTRIRIMDRDKIRLIRCFWFRNYSNPCENKNTTESTDFFFF